MKLIATIFLFFLTCHLSAQVKINGRVADKTGNPVPFASIGVRNSNSSALTNENGEFQINIDKLPVDLIITHVSYQTLNQTVNAAGFLNIKLTLSVTSLNEVTIKPVDPLSVVNKAWSLANANLNKAYFLNAFYRQTITVKDTAKAICELFYKLAWRTNFPKGWRPEQARYATIQDSSQLSIKNQSYLSLLFTGYLFNFSNSEYPHPGSLEKYKVSLDDIIEHEDQNIAVVSCTANKNLRNSGRTYIDVRYFIGLQNFHIYRVETHLYRIPFEGFGYDNDLSTVAVFSDQLYGDAVLQHLSAVLTVGLANKPEKPQFKVRSTITVYGKTPVIGDKDLLQLTQFVADNKIVKSTIYDPDFWRMQQVLKTDSVEQRFIDMMEQKEAFGPMSGRFVSGPSILDYKSSGFKVFYEKPYLQTDRSFFAAGDSILYKAYLLNAQTGNIFDASKTLYVELWSQEGKLINQQLVNLKYGTGDGKFVIPDTLATGIYCLRAYTNWMRNFPDQLTFKKLIAIKGVSVENEKQHKLAFVPNKGPQSNDSAKQTRHQITLFPEGEHLLAGVPGLVVYKHVNTAGNNLAIKGTITTDQDSVISQFSSPDGLGDFLLTPEPKRRYFLSAELPDGTKIKQPVNFQDKDGMALLVSRGDSSLTIGVQMTADIQKANAGKYFTLIIKNNGQLESATQLSATSNICRIKLNKEGLPEGVRLIEVLDAFGKVQTKQLIYFRSTGRLKADVGITKNEPDKKGVVSIKIRVTDPNNIPVQTNLSAALTDGSITTVAGQTDDLLTNLGFRSQISDWATCLNDNIGSEADKERKINQLLLTQTGDRYFWNGIDSNLKVRYPVESGVPVSGKVLETGTNKAISNASVSMMTTSTRGQILSAKSDEQGRFIFQDLNLYGPQSVFMNVKKDRQTQKGYLVVDGINYRKPDGVFMPEILPADYLSAFSGFCEEIDKINQEHRKVLLPPSTLLKTVNITAAGNVVTDTLLTVSNDDLRYKVLSEYLLEKIKGLDRDPGLSNQLVFYGFRSEKKHPDDELEIPEIRFGKIFPRFSSNIVQSMPADRSQYYDIPLDQVKSVRLVHIYSTKRGDTFEFRLSLRSNAFRQDPLVSYFEKEGFYNEKPAFKDVFTNINPSYNPTIYWKPTILTNKKGEATIKVAIPQGVKKIRLSIEGFSNTGERVSVTKLYEP